MVTYALLGATGATGSAALRCILLDSEKDVQLNILVRSKARLLRQFPDLQARERPRIKIFEGTSTDYDALERCLRNARVIFMCVAQNDSAHGMSLTYDTVFAIIKTLELLRQIPSNDDYEPPTILQLRSASLNPRLSCQVPTPVYWMVSFCLHYSHEDILRACQLYEAAAAKGLLHYTYIDPPTIHDANGKTRTGYRLISHEKQDTALSYADLGAAFCEVAERRDDFVNAAVGVTATGKVKETWGVLAGYLLEGAKGRFRGMMRQVHPEGHSTSTGLYCGMWFCKLLRSLTFADYVLQ